MKSLVLLAAALSLLAARLRAQDSEPGSRWSIGTSVTYPLARIYQIHIGYRLDDEGELVFGPAFQNFESGSITSHAYTLILGYRRFLWKGLHVEVELWPAYNSMYSGITESRYPGVELWAEIKLGYRFHFANNLFLQPAPGVGFGILRTNRPPKFAEDIVSPIFAPQLIVGVRL